jgi:gas vesicle protein
MNRVVTGLLIGVGVGVVTGLVVLLLRGKKTQRFLRERWQQYAQQVADQLSHAASKVRVARSDLGDVAHVAQQASSAIKQTGQDVTEKTKQMARQG